MIQVHAYELVDWQEVRQLFYDTVMSINARDYSPVQLSAWAPADDAKLRMKDSLENNISYVAEEEGVIVGFANMSFEGYVDYMFTHKDYQGRGVASLLFKKLEAEAHALGLTKMTTQASITARRFFEKHGFRVVKEQQVEIRNVLLTNFVMEKDFLIK